MAAKIIYLHPEDRPRTRAERVREHNVQATIGVMVWLAAILLLAWAMYGYLPH